jgi:hypothetical protein
MHATYVPLEPDGVNCVMRAARTVSAHLRPVDLSVMTAGKSVSVSLPEDAVAGDACRGLAPHRARRRPDCVVGRVLARRCQGAWGS